MGGNTFASWVSLLALTHILKTTPPKLWTTSSVKQQCSPLEDIVYNVISLRAQWTLTDCVVTRLSQRLISSVLIQTRVQRALQPPTLGRPCEQQPRSLRSAGINIYQKYALRKVDATPVCATGQGKDERRNNLLWVSIGYFSALW